MRKSLSAIAPLCLWLGSCGSPVVELGTVRGPQVAFLSDREGNYDVFLLDMKTDSVVNLTAHPAMDYGFSWSPDGESLAFASDRDGNQEIYVLNLESGALSRLTHDEARDASPCWSPDGTRIAFTSRRDTQSGEIYEMDAEGGDLRRLTENARYEEVPSWSPDGKSIVFGALAPPAEGEDATLQVFKIDVTSGQETQLSFLPGHNSAPRWAPDGLSIVFYGQVGEGFVGADIMQMAVDGSALRNLTNDAEPDWQPDVSPDGKRIVFARGPGDPLDLWTMRADGSERVPLLISPGRDEQPKWRPSSP